MSSPSPLQSWIRAGKVLTHQDYRSKSFYDWGYNSEPGQIVGTVNLDDRRLELPGGAGNYISWGDDSQFDIGQADSRTILFWGYSVLTAAQAIFGKTDASLNNDTGYYLRCQNNDLIFGYNDGAVVAPATIQTATNPINYNAPQWITCVVERAADGTGTIYLYVDGVLMTSGAIGATGSWAKSVIFTMGTVRGDIWNLQGGVNSFTVINDALTLTEIWDLQGEIEEVV